METAADAIQGDCAAKPGPAMSTVTGPALLPLLPRQCLLITDASLLDMNSGLWMDNIYIRLVRTTRTPLNPVLLSSGGESPGLHLTGITLQVPPPPSPQCTLRPSAHYHPPLHVRVTRLLALWHWRLL